MEIHGKEFSTHDGGNIVYYNNILIKSLSNPKINEFYSTEQLEGAIRSNPDFCGCKYHKMMYGHCKQSVFKKNV